MEHYTITYRDAQGTVHAKKPGEFPSVRTSLEDAFWDGRMWVVDQKQYELKSLKISIQPGENGERSIDVLVEYKGVSPDAYCDD